MVQIKIFISTIELKLYKKNCEIYEKINISREIIKIFKYQATVYTLL